MSATPRPVAAPPRTRQTKREPVWKLLSVCLNRERSTPFHELYHAASDSRVGLTIDVRYDVGAKVWTCDPAQCPGFRHYGHCHHCDRAARLRRVQFFAALWAGQPDSTLRRHRAVYQARIDSGMADQDDWAAADFLDLHFTEARAA